MSKKEIEVHVDKDNKIDFKEFIEMKIKYDEEYFKKDNEIEDLKKQIELLVKDDESSQETIIRQHEQIEKLDNIIFEIYRKALDTSITSIDLRDYIISSLGSGKVD